MTGWRLWVLGHETSSQARRTFNSSTGKHKKILNCNDSCEKLFSQYTWDKMISYKRSQTINVWIHGTYTVSLGCTLSICYSAQWRHLFSIWHESSHWEPPAVSHFSLPPHFICSINTPSIQTSSPPPPCMGRAALTWRPITHTHIKKKLAQEGWRYSRLTRLEFSSPFGCGLIALAWGM